MAKKCVSNQASQGFEQALDLGDLFKDAECCRLTHGEAQDGEIQKAVQ